jgi:hypothetical protein
LRAEFECIRSLARLDFGKFSDDLEPVRLGEPLQREAGFAIDYAISSVEQAEWAVLDAVAARAQAKQAKAS